MKAERKPTQETAVNENKTSDSGVFSLPSVDAEGVKRAGKGAAMTAIAAVISQKPVRRGVLRQLMKRKRIRKTLQKIVRTLMKADLIGKRDVRKFSGKKIAKRLCVP